MRYQKYLTQEDTEDVRNTVLFSEYTTHISISEYREDVRYTELSVFSSQNNCILL